MAGSGVATARRARKGLLLRVVTWNIHKGIGGVDRRYRPERTVAVLRRLDADVVALQEVDEGARRSRFHRQVDLLADALGYPHRTFFPNHSLRVGRYGNAVLSRFPLDHVENLDLTVPLKKRRGGLHARFTVTAGARRRRVWLTNVHLGLAEYERRRQVRRLLAWHDRHRIGSGTVVLLVGDFNDVWNRLGRELLEPAGFHAPARRPPTFPAVRPMRALDAVFVRGPARIVRLDAPRSAPVPEASDHLPLRATLRLLPQ